MSENVLTSIFAQQTGSNAVPDLIGESANHPVKKTNQGIYEYMGRNYKPYDGREYQPTYNTRTSGLQDQHRTSTTQRIDPVETRPVVQRQEVTRTVVRETPTRYERTLEPSTTIVNPSPSTAKPYVYQKTTQLPQLYTNEAGPVQSYRYIESPSPALQTRTSEVVSYETVQSPTRRVIQQPTVSTIQSPRPQNPPVLQRAYSYHDLVEDQAPVRNSVVQQSSTNRMLNQSTYHTTESRTNLPAQSTETQYRTYNTNVPAATQSTVTNYRSFDTGVPETQTQSAVTSNYRTYNTSVPAVQSSVTSNNYRTYEAGANISSQTKQAAGHQSSTTTSETTRYQTDAFQPSEITYREVIHPSVTTSTEVTEHRREVIAPVKVPPTVTSYESVQTIKAPASVVKPVVYTETVSTRNKGALLKHILSYYSLIIG